MAGWAGTKTWAVNDPWPITDPNTYIRDNFNSVRMYQNSIQSNFDSATVNTTPTMYGVHSSIMSVTPAESYEMHVIYSIFFHGGAAGTIVNILGVDDANNNITASPSAISMDVSAVTGHTYGIHATIISEKFYTATNCGYALRLWTNAGTIIAEWTSLVLCHPLT